MSLKGWICMKKPVWTGLMLHLSILNYIQFKLHITMCFKCLIPGLMLKALTPNVNIIWNKASNIHDVCIGSKVSPCFVFPFGKETTHFSWIVFFIFKCKGATRLVTILQRICTNITSDRTGDKLILSRTIHFLPIGQVIQFVLSADAVTSRWRNDESGFHSLENMCTSRSHTRLL